MAETASEIAQSPYAVALQLAYLISNQEGKPLRAKTEGASRDYILKLYRECLEAVASQGGMFTPRG
jgi:hypothetical protein